MTRTCTFYINHDPACHQAAIIKVSGVPGSPDQYACPRHLPGVLGPIVNTTDIKVFGIWPDGRIHPIPTYISGGSVVEGLTGSQVPR